MAQNYENLEPASIEVQPDSANKMASHGNLSDFGYFEKNSELLALEQCKMIERKYHHNVELAKNESRPEQKEAISIEQGNVLDASTVTKPKRIRKLTDEQRERINARKRVNALTPEEREKRRIKSKLRRENDKKKELSREQIQHIRRLDAIRSSRYLKRHHDRDNTPEMRERKRIRAKLRRERNKLKELTAEQIQHKRRLDAIRSSRYLKKKRLRELALREELKNTTPEKVLDQSSVQDVTIAPHTVLQID